MRVKTINNLIVDKYEFIKLLSQLIAIPSSSGQENKVQEYIFEWFKVRNIPVKYQTVKDGLINVIATIDNHSNDGKTFLICGHCDTVLPVKGWTTDPFSPKLVGNRLYGIGSMDMKAGLATAMLTMEAMNKVRHIWKGKIVF